MRPHLIGVTLSLVVVTHYLAVRFALRLEHFEDLFGHTLIMGGMLLSGSIAFVMLAMKRRTPTLLVYPVVWTVAAFSLRYGVLF